MATQAAAIRRLAPADLADYRRIRLSAMRTSPDAFGSTYEIEAAMSDDACRRRLVTSVVLGAMAGNEIVGLVGCRQYENARETHKASLWGFFVEPAYRRSGVGAALIDAVLDAMPDTVEQILLTVVAGNAPAIALYERLGFARYGVEPRSLKRQGGYVDEMLMIAFLPSGSSRVPPG